MDLQKEWPPATPPDEVVLLVIRREIDPTQHPESVLLAGDWQMPITPAPLF
jgi:hypothetical protein